MIEATVVFCLTLNPTMCRTLPIAPVDHAVVSIADCIKGGAIYEATTFRLDYAEWTVRGWRCREIEPLDMTAMKRRVTP